MSHRRPLPPNLRPTPFNAPRAAGPSRLFALERAIPIDGRATANLAGMQKPPTHQTPKVDRHVALAACSVSPLSAATIAVAPCFFQVPSQATGDLVEIQVTPAGEFRPRDGRELPVAAWRIDAAIAAKVIERFTANKTPLVVDYEHQTLQTETNGQPAPAAGFIRDLQWREGYGLVAMVEFTARARQYVAGGEYKFFSPVFSYDKRTGAVQELLMGALTNNPALDGMTPIALRAAARFHLNTEEPAMINKHLLAICVALAIATDNQTEDQLGLAALAAVKNRPDPLAKLRADLGLAETVGAEEVSTAVAALKTKAATAGNPDPKKFVGVEVVEDLRTQIAALSATSTARAIDDLVKPALEDGRLLSAQEKWARDLGKSDIAALTAYLDGAAPIAALRRTQTDGQEPAGGKDGNGLTVAELAVCKATGIDPKAFATAKAA